MGGVFSPLQQPVIGAFTAEVNVIEDKRGERDQWPEGILQQNQRTLTVQPQQTQRQQVHKQALEGDREDRKLRWKDG